MSDEECVYEFIVRQKQRLTYPGACAIQYQDFFDILVSELLQWDMRTQSAKRPGVIGTVEAFGPADEEQGRGTLHSHWQIWIKELSQELRDSLFDEDQEKRNKNRDRFYCIIDQLLHTTFGPGLTIEHKCTSPIDSEVPTCQPISTSKPTLYSPDTLLKGGDEQLHRDARNRILSKHIEGRIMFCKMCDESFSGRHLIESSLETLRDDLMEKHQSICNKGKDCKICDTYISLPLIEERIAIAVMRHSYDAPGGCTLKDHPFWDHPDVRDILLRWRFDNHDWKHRPSCFKKGCDCRFSLPCMYCGKTYIYEDLGKQNKNVVEWYRLVQGDILHVPPWLVMTKRPMGCQYMNTHNKYISQVLCCNTNIQCGDRSHVYYSTCYCGKNTQKEDRERSDRTNHACSKRLYKQQQQVADGTLNKGSLKDGFVEGLCRMLSALHASYSRMVISATMQHRLVCNGGTRFLFSHQFNNLLLTQLEAILDGKDVKVRIRSNKLCGEQMLWPDSPGFDYLERPKICMFDEMCIYEFTMYFRKTFKSASQMRNNIPESSKIEIRHGGSEQDESIVGLEDDKERYMGQGFSRKWTFTDEHPGSQFCVIAELKKMVIPKIFMPQDRLPHIRDLKIDDIEVDDHTVSMREEYAKLALMLFYPHRNMKDLKTDDGHWALFYQQLQLKRQNKPTAFWNKGFDILQNMQDRRTLDKNVKKASDNITNETENRTPDDSAQSEYNTGIFNTETDDMDDILKYSDPYEYVHQHTVISFFSRFVIFSHFFFFTICNIFSCCLYTDQT